MSQQNQLSPEKYIRTRARTLEIYECYVNKEWQSIGMAQILVTRKHKTGNVTLGFYLVDTFALGVKDTFYRFNYAPTDYQELLDKLIRSFENDVNDEFVKIRIRYGT